MIIDTTGRKPILLPVKKDPIRGQNEAVAAGDVVEVEIIRSGKSIYKGR